MGNMQVVFTLEVPEEVETDHQANDTYAGACEHSFGSDFPSAGDKAGVDGVPVPDHLRQR